MRSPFHRIYFWSGSTTRIPNGPSVNSLRTGKKPSITNIC